jgi:cyanate permease
MIVNFLDLFRRLSSLKQSVSYFMGAGYDPIISGSLSNENFRLAGQFQMSVSVHHTEETSMLVLLC